MKMGESKVNHEGQSEDNRKDLVTIKTYHWNYTLCEEYRIGNTQFTKNSPSVLSD